MSFLPPLIFLLFIIIVIMLCEWQVVAAFVVAIVAVPFVIFFATGLQELVFKNKAMDWEAIFTMSGIFALAGIALYFVFIIPLYYLLKSLPLPLHFSFPVCLAILSFVFFMLVARDPMDIWILLAVMTCGLVHSLLILWLIAKFKGIEFAGAGY